jgi:hypothetical protein
MRKVGSAQPALRKERAADVVQRLGLTTGALAVVLMIGMPKNVMILACMVAGSARNQAHKGLEEPSSREVGMRSRDLAESKHLKMEEASRSSRHNCLN